MKWACRLRGNNDDWFQLPEDPTQYGQLSEIRISRDGSVINILVKVPLLKDPNLYAGWLDRSTKFLNGDKSIPYEKYEVLEHIDHAYKNLYLADNEVNYEYGDIIERWGMDHKGKFTYAIFEKDEYGTVMNAVAEEFETRLYPHMFEQGDLYKHPGNKSIHSIEALLESPPDAYIGDSLYYNPKCGDRILVRLGDNWLWTSLWEFGHRTPTHLQDEFELLKGTVGIAKKKTVMEQGLDELMFRI